ncbi:MAG: acylphosphatase [Spirochaetia bacterium]|nr:acylphosphatase [Spirochaetia bacterium]
MSKIQYMEIRHYIILGKVQGVGYRYYTEDIAKSSRIRGWVKNQPDGSVECLAAGQPADLEMFEKKIRKGPPLSRVVNMERKILVEGEIDIPENFSVL